MNSLPLLLFEYLFKILKHYETVYKSLFYCLLVTHVLCIITLPFIWSKPDLTHKNIIRILILGLNENEKALLPKEIIQTIPNLLFEYSSYTNTVTSNDLNKVVKEWLRRPRPSYKISIHFSFLILMFLQTNKKLNLKVDDMDEVVYFRSSELKDLLSLTLSKNDFLISLKILSQHFGFKKRGKTLEKILSENTTLTLHLSNTRLGNYGRKAIVNGNNEKINLMSLTL
ncbi:hypothetical protein F8M41_015543 [Gigaspora margarita]|uniref:Uncharacterized protein n=1 Tax=Gigaspora margarita TaxID=4874 RepID=A0A8H4AQM5_GIGMA|nr:hypothetical protein F8M41_015543 [Gigaspora margarita]